MSSQVQDKFSNLRKRLDQLGYRQPLGIESLPLVERLFADLLHTTESLRNVKISSARSPRDKADVESQIEPYKNDNSRLVKENNELHMQLIRAKEDADRAIAEFKASLRKLEHENNDLKFLNNQYVHKIRAMERESKEKSDHILKLQEKNFNAVIQTPGGKKKHVPFRRQRLVLDSTLPASEVSTAPSIPSRDDPFVADLLRVADNRIAELEGELERTRDKSVALEGKMATYSRQIESRDAEIERLGRVLDGGRPYDVVALEARNRSNEKLISHLNIQIDYLQQKNKDLEKRLDDAIQTEVVARKQAVTADQEKTNLAQSLREADRTARRLEEDRKAVISAADKELADAKLELSKNRKELERLDLEVAQLRAESDRLGEENHKLCGDLKSRSADFERLENLVDKTQQDKRKLGLRINRLIQTEKELIIELDKYKHSKKGPASQAAKLRNRSPNRFDQLIKNIELERDYWKREVERLQEILTYKRIGSPNKGTRSASASPVKSNPSPTRTSRSPIRSSPSKYRSTSANDKLTSALQTANEERDFYKEEYERMKSEMSNSRRRNKDSSPERYNRFEDRDKLQTDLERLQVDVNEMERELRVVCNERDRLKDMYEDTKHELNKCRQQLLKSTPTKSLSLAGQHLLIQVEKERDEAVADLRHMTTERDSLRERLQVATETQINERVAHDNRIEEIQGRLKRSQQDKMELESQVNGLRSQISQLEDELRVQAARYNEANEEGRQLKHKSNQLRMLSDETERSLRDAQQRLEVKESEIQSLTIRQEELMNRLSECDKLNSSQKSEMSQLRSTISALDKEKDNLQSLLDDKTERLARLDDECAAQEERANSMIRNNRDVTRQLEHSEDTIKLKDREILSLRKQIDGISMELDEVTRTKDEILRENKLLEEDLTNMTSENQRLSTDIRELIDERAQLSDQVQEYIQEVRRVEDVLSRKEEERTTLLEQYRHLTMETERYESQTTHLEGQASNLKRDLQVKDQNIRRLQENIELMDKELQQTQVSYHSLESQVANQNRVIETLELKIRELEAERYNLEKDMTATRDLSARLEHNKDSVQRKLAAKELECERAADTIEELEREISALKDRSYSDRQELVKLEQVLANNREKEFQAQLAVQESSSEIQLMKDRLILNDSKIESQSREITQLRNRILDLENDLDRSRHQLTNERFEREKTAQELRRVSELSRSVGNTRSSYLSVTSQGRSGTTTPSVLATPNKLLSPAPSRGRSPTPVRSMHSVTGSQSGVADNNRSFSSLVHGDNK